jgi:predicted TIM-barrel fold metal-dependent hydrolase
VKALGGNIPRVKQAAPRGIDYELQRLYFETANGAWKPNLAALLGYVPISQVMFGTDYPYLTVGSNLEGLRRYGLSEADLKAIQYENAARILPVMKV